MLCSALAARWRVYVRAAPCYIVCDETLIGCNPLLASRAGARTRSQMIHMSTLLEAGADPNHADELGNRPLHMVCWPRSCCGTYSTCLSEAAVTRAWPPTSPGQPQSCSTCATWTTLRAKPQARRVLHAATAAGGLLTLVMTTATWIP